VVLVNSGAESDESVVVVESRGVSSTNFSIQDFELVEVELVREDP